MRTTEALERVAAYLDARTGMAGLDPDEINNVWVGNEDKPRRLLLSDLQTLTLALSALNPPLQENDE